MTKSNLLIDVNYMEQLLGSLDKTLLSMDKSFFQQMSVVPQLTAHFGQQISDFNFLRFSVDIPRIYGNLPQINTSSWFSALDLSNEFLNAVKTISINQSSYIQQIAEIAHGLNSITQKLAADLTAFRISFDSILSAGIFDNLIRFVDENEDASEAFNAAGWPIAPSMPKSLKGRVVEIHKQGKTRYASQIIMGYYRRNGHQNLNLTVDGWKDHPLFAPRLQIIKDALKAHCNGDYTLSIPTLLPQVEGILNDYVRSNQLNAKFGKVAEVYKAVIGDPDEHDFSTWAIANTLLFQLQSNTYAYTSFEAELSKPIKSRKTTRHTVLHGVAINYDKPANSLRIFLTLDAISALQNV